MEIKEPYTVINIPLETKEDAKRIKLICKLTGVKREFIVKDFFDWFTPHCSNQLINVAVIINKKNNKKVMSWGGRYDYKDWFKNQGISNYMEIDYKDFLKYKKISTIELLKNYEKEY